MTRIVIEVKDNPQGVNLKKVELLKDIKKKFLDLGLIISVVVEN